MTRNDFIAASKEDLKETPFLYYVNGYKYQSRNSMIYQTFIYPEQDIVTDLVVLRTDGWMWVGKYFAHDGCSGPTIDTASNMRAGQAHDALYALLRMGLLDQDQRYAADTVLYRLMRMDGAPKWRARYYERAVNNFAGGSASTKNSRKIKVAPHCGVMPDGAPA